MKEFKPAINTARQSCHENSNVMFTVTLIGCIQSPGPNVPPFQLSQRDCFQMFPWYLPSSLIPTLTIPTLTVSMTLTRTRLTDHKLSKTITSSYQVILEHNTATLTIPTLTVSMTLTRQRLTDHKLSKTITSSYKVILEHNSATLTVPTFTVSIAHTSKRLTDHKLLTSTEVLRGIRTEYNNPDCSCFSCFNESYWYKSDHKLFGIGSYNKVGT